MRGTIVRMSPKSGIGYIKTRDDEEIMFDEFGLAGYKFSDFEVGNKVEFTIEDGAKGPRAVRISITF